MDKFTIRVADTNIKKVERKTLNTKRAEKGIKLQKLYPIKDKDY